MSSWKISASSHLFLEQVPSFSLHSSWPRVGITGNRVRVWFRHHSRPSRVTPRPPCSLAAGSRLQAWAPATEAFASGTGPCPMERVRHKTKFLPGGWVADASGCLPFGREAGRSWTTSSRDVGGAGKTFQQASFLGGPSASLSLKWPIRPWQEGGVK